jgi:Mg/Co/Ni transporter MgtE
MTPLNSTVGSADTLLHLVPPVVSPRDDVRTLVQAIARDPLARCAFVTDGDGRLLGVVPVDEIDRDLLLLLAPGVAVQELVTARQAARLAHGLDETAQRLMRAPACVGLDDTLADAVRRMAEHHQESAAVVDATGALMGYVALFELLAGAVVTAS